MIPLDPNSDNWSWREMEIIRLMIVKKMLSKVFIASVSNEQPLNEHTVHVQTSPIS